MIFCMKVPYYKSKKRARRFFRKNSGSLIMRKNVFFALSRIFKKKLLNFWHQMVFGFWKIILRTTTGEKMRKILRAVFEKRSRLQIIIFVSKFKKNFLKSPNGSIRKVNWLESKSEHFLQNQASTGGSEA